MINKEMIKQWNMETTSLPSGSLCSSRERQKLSVVHSRSHDNSMENNKAEGVDKGVSGKRGWCGQFKNAGREGLTKKVTCEPRQNWGRLNVGLREKHSRQRRWGSYSVLWLLTQSEVRNHWDVGSERITQLIFWYKKITLLVMLIIDCGVWGW